MTSFELHRAIALQMIDNYGAYTIHGSDIQVMTESGAELFIVAFDGRIRITSTIKELLGKDGYSELAVNELKTLASDAGPRISPVEIIFIREGCDAFLYLQLTAPCASLKDVPDILSASMKKMDEAFNSIFQIEEEHREQQEADCPF